LVYLDLPRRIQLFPAYNRAAWIGMRHQCELFETAKRLGKAKTLWVVCVSLHGEDVLEGQLLISDAGLLHLPLSKN
jgi:hypothetical protein